MLSLILRSDVLEIGCHKYSESPDLEPLLSALRSSEQRTVEIESEGKRWRKAIIDDALGLYLLYDYEISKCLELNLCFLPSEGAFSPSNTFNGRLFIDKIAIASGSSGKPLLGQSSLKFSRAGGGWEAASEFFLVYVRRRGSDLIGNVSISFLRRPRFSVEK
jgi:hypothetical protein